MDKSLYPIAVIAAIALVTWALRAVPFLLFGGRPLPKTVQYLGQVLPPAIMTALVIYFCAARSLRHTPMGFRNWPPAHW